MIKSLSFAMASIGLILAGNVTSAATNDAVIPCVLENTINAELSGPVFCIVSEHNPSVLGVQSRTKFYGTVTGSPSGEMTSVDIIWRRLIKPDGSIAQIAEGTTTVNLNSDHIVPIGSVFYFPALQTNQSPSQKHVLTSFIRDYSSASDHFIELAVEEDVTLDDGLTLFKGDLIFCLPYTEGAQGRLQLMISCTAFIAPTSIPRVIVQNHTLLEIVHVSGLDPDQRELAPLSISAGATLRLPLLSQMSLPIVAQFDGNNLADAMRQIAEQCPDDLIECLKSDRE